MAVVLSGGGSDGSRGVRDVHEAGGLVLVQSPGTAQFDSMPRAARDTGIGDWILAPEDMPHVLLEQSADPSARGGRGPRAASPEVSA